MTLETKQTGLDLRQRKKTRGPRRRLCRKAQNEDEVTVHHRNDVFFVCKKCINNLSDWPNLTPTERIRANSSFTDDTMAVFKDNGLPDCNSVDLCNYSTKNKNERH